MPVPPALRAVHGILGEDGVEHVGAVDLAGEVAVVAGVVAAEEVAEGRLAVAWGGKDHVVSVGVGKREGSFENEGNGHLPQS